MRPWLLGAALIVTPVVALAQTPPRVTAPDAAQAPAASPAGDEPTAATLGLPIYPAAQFLLSYDAGRGQRYYLFGATAAFMDVVAYYRSALKEKGILVFESPATHMFEVGRFREETMAFPPGVTVKDYSGTKGFPSPRPGATPPRFPTVIQIVPVPPGGGR